MPKKINASSTIMFFFLITESIFFSIMFFIIYPVLGIDINIILSELPPSLSITIIVYTISCIFIYYMLKPIDKILDKKDNNQEVSSDEILLVRKKEKFIKKFLIILNITGFVLVPIASTG